MKINVLNFLEKDSVVEFAAQHGQGVAKWVGDKPIQGQSYDIELDIDDDLVWGETISLVSSDQCSISNVGQSLKLVAKIISCENDGCISVDLGGNVVLLDVEDTPDGVFGFVEFTARDVKLYLVNL